jgi:hypothetical protein
MICSKQILLPIEKGLRGEEDPLEPKEELRDKSLSMPLEESLRLVVILGTILDLVIGIKSSLLNVRLLQITFTTPLRPLLHIGAR